MLNKYLYYLPKIVRVVKTKRIRWLRHVDCMSIGSVYTGFSGETHVKETAWEIKVLVGA